MTHPVFDAALRARRSPPPLIRWYVALVVCLFMVERTWNDRRTLTAPRRWDRGMIGDAGGSFGYEHVSPCCRFSSNKVGSIEATSTVKAGQAEDMVTHYSKPRGG